VGYGYAPVSCGALRKATDRVRLRRDRVSGTCMDLWSLLRCHDMSFKPQHEAAAVSYADAHVAPELPD
jgi:hypothetical protein